MWVSLQPDSYLFLRLVILSNRGALRQNRRSPRIAGATRRWTPREQNAAEAARAADSEVILSLAQAAAQRLGLERRGLPDVSHEPAVERVAHQPDQGIPGRF